MQQQTSRVNLRVSTEPAPHLAASAVSPARFPGLPTCLIPSASALLLPSQTFPQASAPDLFTPQWPVLQGHPSQNRIPISSPQPVAAHGQHGSLQTSPPVTPSVSGCFPLGVPVPGPALGGALGGHSCWRLAPSHPGGPSARSTVSERPSGRPVQSPRLHQLCLLPLLVSSQHMPCEITSSTYG